jgi:hypothetical protein
LQILNHLTSDFQKIHLDRPTSTLNAHIFSFSDFH